MVGKDTPTTESTAALRTLPRKSIPADPSHTDEYQTWMPHSPCGATPEPETVRGVLPELWGKGLLH